VPPLATKKLAGARMGRGSSDLFSIATLLHCWPARTAQVLDTQRGDFRLEVWVAIIHLILPAAMTGAITEVVPRSGAGVVGVNLADIPEDICRDDGDRQETRMARHRDGASNGGRMSGHIYDFSS
jgi:hypothetical protein